MTDLTIREIRTTLLQLPWADDPWLFGHALGASSATLWWWRSSPPPASPAWATCTC